MSIDKQMTTGMPVKLHGFTLLENLVALLILSIGLLGIAGLQAFTLKSGTSSAMRLTAIQQANEMADRIRANVGGVYPPPGGTRLYDAVTPATVPTSKDCAAGACTPAEIEAYDIKQWYDSNLATLPGVTGYSGGYITRTDLSSAGGANILLYPGSATNPGPPRARFTIIMRWDGERTGAKGLTCPPASDTDMNCYLMEVDL